MDIDTNALILRNFPGDLSPHRDLSTRVDEMIRPSSCPHMALGERARITILSNAPRSRQKFVQGFHVFGPRGDQPHGPQGCII